MESLVARIRQRYEAALETIARHARNSGRQPEAVRLVVVTKAQPEEVVRAVLEAGVPLLGENYPEEALSKINVFAGQYQVEWHMIGHIQSRKARLVAGNFALVHSVDRLKIARKLSALAQAHGMAQEVLLEFNVGGERSKSGWLAHRTDNWEALLPELEEVVSLPGLHIRGLMTMPPLARTPEEARRYFRTLRQLRDWLAQQFPQVNWAELSMGTSGDYPVAVEEGATLVRIGQAIVGPRPPKPS